MIWSMRKIFILILSLIVFQVTFVPISDAAIKTGSKCTSKDYNRGTKIKVGSVTFTCIGADSGYFWYPVPKSNTANSSGFGTILSKPAQNYVVAGQSLVTVQNYWGISFNTGTRPITLKELGDSIYSKASGLTGKWLTKNEIQISLQPGNGLYTLLNGLMLNTASYDAIVYEITAQGAKH